MMAAEFDLRPHFQRLGDRARRAGDRERPVQDHERVLEAAANLVGRRAHGNLALTVSVRIMRLKTVRDKSTDRRPPI